MFNAAEYLHHLLPESMLFVGALVILLIRREEHPGRWPVAAVLALLTLLTALATTVVRGAPGEPVLLPGLLITSLTHYVRLIGLGIGTLLLLVNWTVPDRREGCEFFALFLLALAGLLLTAASNDLVVLFFAIELVSVPTYVLVVLSRLDVRAAEAGVKYFFLGALAAALLVYGFSFLYGATGATVLRDGSPTCLAARLGEPLSGAAATYALVGLLLALAGLFFKTAAVPFHVYAPDVYEGAASPISALLSFLPKLAGLVGMIQVLGVWNWHLPVPVQWVLWCVAALSMTVGNALALLQTNVKRILAYSSIAHTGYLLVGLLVGPLAGAGPLRDGVAALLFYIAVYGVMNLGAFAVLAALRTPDGPVEQLDDLRGLSVRRPEAALVMAICMFSLMGFPPTAGFLGKVYIFASAFSADAPAPFRGSLLALAIIGVVNSAVAAAYYLRVAAACYLGAERVETERQGGAPMRFSLTVCATALLALFVWSAPLVSRARSAAVIPMLRAEPRAAVSSAAPRSTGEFGDFAARVAQVNQAR